MLTTQKQTLEELPKITPAKKTLKGSKTPQTMQYTNQKPSNNSKRFGNKSASSDGNNLIFTIQKNSPPGISISTPKVTQWEERKTDVFQNEAPHSEKSGYQTLLEKFVEALPIPDDEPLTFANRNTHNNDFMVSHQEKGP